jgi:NitT/TauT family transport system permease protein
VSEQAPSAAVTAPPEARSPAAAPGAGGAAAARIGRWLLTWVYPLALILLVWQLLSASGALGNAFVMPAPAAVWQEARFMAADGSLPDGALATVRRVLIAYALALAVGIALGTLIGRLRPVRQALRPLMSFLFPTPKVALYPAMLIIFGLGSGSKVAFGFAEAVFPILLATAAATSQIEPRLVWSAAALGTPPYRAFWKVVVPAALPGILTGARIGFVGALIGVFLGEMIAGADGLGQLMSAAYDQLRTAQMYVAIIAVSLIGLALDRLFLLARARLLAWSAEEDH